MNESLRRQIHSKLHSESGASLAVALLFFVMCAVVGSVILAAAGSTAGRISRLKGSDSAKYAVSSAAQLIRETALEDTEPLVWTSDNEKFLSLKEDFDSGSGNETGNSNGSGSGAGAGTGGSVTENDDSLAKSLREIEKNAIKQSVTGKSDEIKELVRKAAEEAGANEKDDDPTSPDRTYTNVITLPDDFFHPANNAPSSVSIGNITITAGGTSAAGTTSAGGTGALSDYPIVNGIVYMKDNVVIQIVLQARENGSGNSGDGSSGTSETSGPVITVELEPDPGTVQYDLVLGDSTAEQEASVNSGSTESEAIGTEGDGIGSTEGGSTGIGDSSEQQMIKRYTCTIRYNSCNIYYYDRSKSSNSSTGSSS